MINEIIQVLQSSCIKISELIKTKNLLKLGSETENKKSQEGKIRLLYEAIPFAFIFEIAGGIASNGYKRLLDVEYSEIHQRTPIILSSKYEFSKL